MNGKWVSIKKFDNYINKYTTGFTYFSSSQGLPINLNFSTIYGQELPPGYYRIGKKIKDSSKIIYVEFTITK